MASKAAASSASKVLRDGLTSAKTKTVAGTALSPREKVQENKKQNERA